MNTVWCYCIPTNKILDTWWSVVTGLEVLNTMNNPENVDGFIGVQILDKFCNTKLNLAIGYVEPNSDSTHALSQTAGWECLSYLATLTVLQSADSPGKFHAFAPRPACRFWLTCFKHFFKFSSSYFAQCFLLLFEWLVTWSRSAQLTSCGIL